MIPFIVINHHKGAQCNPWAIKHGTRRCDLKRYAKRVLFKADFAAFLNP